MEEAKEGDKIKHSSSSSFLLFPPSASTTLKKGRGKGNPTLSHIKAWRRRRRRKIKGKVWEKKKELNQWPNPPTPLEQFSQLETDQFEKEEIGIISFCSVAQRRTFFVKVPFFAPPGNFLSPPEQISRISGFEKNEEVPNYFCFSHYRRWGKAYFLEEEKLSVSKRLNLPSRNVNFSAVFANICAWQKPFFAPPKKTPLLLRISLHLFPPQTKTTKGFFLRGGRK